jgi:ABC-type Fe3+/spermidine/putrescine transport system ATPase subunit
VEDFLGHVLRFRGHVLEQGPEGALVGIGGASGTYLRAEGVDDAVAAGDAVLAAIRPEELQVHRAGEGPRHNTMRAAVEKVLYLGSECELLLRMQDLSYTLLVSRAMLARVGPEVDLYLPPEHLRVWPEVRSPRADVYQATPDAVPVATI